MNKKIFITAKFACMRRYQDRHKLIVYFKANECEIVENPEEANCIVYVTCGFSKLRCDNTIEHIKELKRYGKELMILGCIPATDPEGLNAIFDGKSLATKSLGDIDKLFPKFKTKYRDIKDLDTINTDFKEHMPVKTFFTEFKLRREFIKRLYNYFAKKVKGTVLERTALFRISDGCLHNCSYCAIRNATGKLKSKPLNECLEEYKKLMDAGYNNIIIDAEETGSYGLDIGTTLGVLLTELNKLTPGSAVKWSIQTLHLSYALKFRKKILNFIKTGRITSIKIDVQSGSERILKLMNRNYNVKEVKQLYEDCRKASRNLIITSHFIVGFPTEKDEDFQETRNYICSVDLDHIDFYIYTDMIGTEAYKITDKVPGEIVAERLDKAKKMLESRGYTVTDSAVGASAQKLANE